MQYLNMLRQPRLQPSALRFVFVSVEYASQYTHKFGEWGSQLCGTVFTSFRLEEKRKIRKISHYSAMAIKMKLIMNQRCCKIVINNRIMSKLKISLFQRVFLKLRSPKYSITVRPLSWLTDFFVCLKCVSTLSDNSRSPVRISSPHLRNMCQHSTVMFHSFFKS
jgi:hypothetical protein